MAEITYYDWREGYFLRGEERDPEEPRGHAIRALKRELVYVGTGRRINVDHATYGDAMANAVRDFQRASGQIPDAVVGARTCRQLFHPRVRAVEEKHGIPNDYLCRMLDLESAWYPAARNSGGDTGLAQINLGSHDVTEAQAYDPAFAVPWAAERLAAKRRELSKLVPKQTWTRKWWAALYAHNAPAFADDWLRAGCPATGGPSIQVGGKAWDGFEWATLYVGVILNRVC